MENKTLITGGAGYIGSVLAEHLLYNGYKVTCLDNFSVGQESSRSLLHLVHKPEFDFIFGDVRDRKTLEKLIPKYDIIIPLAGIVGAPQCDLNPVDAVLVNRDAIININKIRTTNQKLIYPNTNSGYGVTTGEVFCTEETPLNPVSIYGKTKCEAENVLLSEGKPVVTLRLATVFGMSPRMRTDVLVNYFTLKAITDGSLVVYQKNFKRNFVPVRDVARCFQHCIENFESMQGYPYNVGLDDANLSKQELAERIKKQIPGFKIIYQEIGSDPDKRNYIVSNKRLASTGFKPKHNLDEGITELIKGYNVMFGGTVFRQ
jgi:nucleoside-diphosphate-sugar epimerase